MINEKIIRNEEKVFHTPLINGLDKVEEVLYKAISDSHGNTRKICTNLISSGGKRIRPALVLCTSQCFSELKEKAIQTAVAYELIHMASLVHDDIIDASTTRRNRPTVNAQMGNQVSVLVGDYLFAKAFEILSSNTLIESMNLVVEAIAQMCDGEVVQAANKFNLYQGIDDYYQRIYKKTGILIAACCQAGAIIGGADEKEVECLKMYGKNLGYAFQIIDDILDFTGTEEILGKPVGNDLKDGNITLPILKLIQQKEYRLWLQKVFNEGGITLDKHHQILRLLKDSYALEDAYQEAVLCVKTAKEALRPIKDSDSKRILQEIADKVLKRKN
ncbi:polyprenyl synthetase family protein [Clostridiaceae bacterium 35-E11]